jgi:type III pantothenate kinase
MSLDHLKIDPLIISASLDTGLRILYDTPRTVGADRICNAVAGFHHLGGPLIVVDFGTATTFDVVSSDQEYLGGVIALGLLSASRELHRLAAKLPRVDMIFPEQVVGKDTETSMQSGIMWGTVLMVDGMIRKIKHEMGWKDEARVVATGGMARMIVERSRHVRDVRPHLTLEGMRLIFQRNRS